MLQCNHSDFPRLNLWTDFIERLSKYEENINDNYTVYSRYKRELMKKKRNGIVYPLTRWFITANNELKKIVH